MKTVLFFILGGAVCLAFAWLFSRKTKGVFRALLNTLAGGVGLAIIGLSGFASAPLNAFNALAAGLLGLPGLLGVLIVANFL